MQVRPENWIHNKMKNRLNSRRPGVTMVELLIATGVFSLFMFSIYGVFEYSRSGFNSGSWRIQRQKQAQTFLLRLKELLERSSHAYAVAPNGATSKVADRPTVINGTWYNKVASTTNHGILYFSITTPFVPEQPELGQEKRMGIWKGVGLDCKDKTLKLYLTGVWDEMPAHTPVEVGSPDLDRFAYGNTEGDYITSLPDVEAIGVSATLATPTPGIERMDTVFITVELLLENQRSRQKAQIIERMTASLADRNIDEGIKIAPAGSYPTP